jgi:hypothetical protein
MSKKAEERKELGQDNSRKGVLFILPRLRPQEGVLRPELDARRFGEVINHRPGEALCLSRKSITK